ncbi:MAG: hypothetical protein A3K18_13480 [Lentisphaerae bacterium RIFOXYA12_64_32]|nr:MAG: hypothetical protein A3K18_13480 [Lentisphaerae bacterium RIFOXYA12_64_32]
MSTTEVMTGGFSADRRGDHMNIPRPEILAGIAGYSQDDQDDLLWLHGYALDMLHGSRSALVDWLQIDWTTITRIWRGKYEADIAKVMAKIRHQRRKAELAQDAGFIETVTVRKIFDALDAVRETNVIALISGASGRSKSHAAKEWVRRNNHGRAYYVDCPVTGGLRALLDEIAARTGVGRSKNNADLCDILSRSFDYRHTLIFDEVARLLPARSNSIVPIEFLRRLHDTTGCGLVLVATEVFPREMRGGRLSSWFEQLLGRLEIPLHIPDRVTRREVAEICAAFCKGDPEPELINMALDIANKPGRVRRLFTLLRHAATIAASRRTALGAVHFAAARDKQANINVWPQD